MGRMRRRRRLVREAVGAERGRRRRLVREVVGAERETRRRLVWEAVGAEAEEAWLEWRHGTLLPLGGGWGEVAG